MSGGDGATPVLADESGRDDPGYERFNFLVNAPALFNAITTAAELRIFHLLRDEPGSGFDRIRAETGLPAHQLRVLLQAVCAAGLLRRDQGAYTNTPVAADLLASDAEDSWTHILIGWREIYYPAFADTTTALRAGRNTALDRYPGNEPTLYQRLSRDPALETVFHRAMTAFTLRSLDALAGHPGFGSLTHLLDVGGGDGTTSARLAARHPGLRCTVFDMPSVTRLAGTTADAAASAGRVHFHAGDIFADPYPSDVDGVLFSHVLEIFSEQEILGQLKKARDVLPSGGRVFVYGYNVSDDETAGVFGARLGLYFNVLASGQGMAYPARDYEQWLREAGFSAVDTVRGLPYEHGLTTGRK